MSDQKKNAQPPVDTALLILVLVLAVFGLIILLSASEYNGRVRFHDSAYYFKKQLFATSLGLGAMYVISTMNYRFFVRLAPAAYLLSMLLSTAVLLVGQEINGSKRWLNLGPLSFQPSEFAKVAVILFLTWQIEYSRRRTDGFWFMCRTMLTLLPIVGLVGSNNLSTAIIIFCITMGLIFIAHPKVKPFLIAAGEGIVLIIIFVMILSSSLETSSSFRLRRILVWLHPEDFASGDGYQTIQALYAIRKNMKKASRPFRGFMRLEAVDFLAVVLVTAYKNWASSPKPRMI